MLIPIFQAIKKLEKQLKLKKRKGKGLPTSFKEDGLDYLLDVLDPEKLQNLDSDDDEEMAPVTNNEILLYFTSYILQSLVRFYSVGGPFNSYIRMDRLKDGGKDCYKILSSSNFL